jgi:alkylhydroperoxidase family enzyme
MEPEGGWASAPRPRVRPIRREQLPLIPRAVMRIVARRARVSAPNLFLTLARHRRLLRSWVRFASKLMPFGTLGRVERELVILRVAWNCRSKYEWAQHVTIGLAAGLTRDDVARVTEGPDAPGWSPLQAAVLRAADEIHRARVVSDGTWQELARHYDDKKLIELCMLIGQYEMLAGVLNSLGVEVEPSP